MANGTPTIFFEINILFYILYIYGCVCVFFFLDPTNGHQWRQLQARYAQAERGGVVAAR